MGKRRYRKPEQRGNVHATKLIDRRKREANPGPRLNAPEPKPQHKADPVKRK